MTHNISLEPILADHGLWVPANFLGFYMDIEDILSTGIPPRDLCKLFAENYKTATSKRLEFEDSEANVPEIQQRYSALYKQCYDRRQEMKISKGDVDDDLFSYIAMYHACRLLVLCIGKFPDEMKEYIVQSVGEPYNRELLDELMEIKQK